MSSPLPASAETIDSHHDASAEELVAAIQAAHAAGRMHRCNALFARLEQRFETTITRAVTRYAASSIAAEVPAEAHLCLWRSVLAYTPAHAARGACPFGGFFHHRLMKACSAAYAASQPNLGEGVKIRRSVRRIRENAAAAGVDVGNVQAVFDFAVEHGERPMLLRRNLTLLGGAPVSLNAPLHGHGNDNAGCLADLVADQGAATPGRHDDETPLRNQRALAAMRALPAEQRRVIVRRFGLDGHPCATVAEIARVEKKSTSTIHERLERALRRMRQAVNIYTFPGAGSIIRAA